MDNLNIIINGVILTQAQALTVHVALQSFAAQLTSDKHPLGDDLTGNFIVDAYLANIDAIEKIYFK